MTKEEVRDGILPYNGEIAILREFLNDWKSEMEFDVEFHKNRLGHFPKQPLSGNALLLGLDGHGTRNFYLDLLQHMVFCGMAEVDVRDGVVYYRSIPFEASQSA